MRREYVVKSIDSSPDGSPSVVVSLTSAKDARDGMHAQARAEPRAMMEFTNINDMVKDLNRMFSGAAGATGVTAIRMDIPEYKKMGLSVGDRVFLELTKAESPGV